MTKPGHQVIGILPSFQSDSSGSNFFFAVVLGGNYLSTELCRKAMASNLIAMASNLMASLLLVASGS